MGIKAVIKKTIAFVLMFIGFMMVGTLAHEVGHLTVNNLLGGTGEIYYDYTWMSGHMSWGTLPKENIWMVYVGGGILAAIFMFLFFWIPPRLTPSKQDVYVEGTVAANILNNLLYAPTELVLYYRGIELFEWVYQTAYIVAAILFLILYTRVLVKWIINHNNHNNKAG